MISQPMALPKTLSIKNDWLFSKTTDLLFFYGSILVGIICYGLLQLFEQRNSLILIVLAASVFGAGPLHLGASLFPYFDKRNLQYFKSTAINRKIFFYAPPLIFALSVILSLICTPLVVFIFLVWTIQHLVQQNIGILLLYHRSNSGQAIVNRTIEARSQQISALFFSLLYFHRVLLNNMPSMLLNVLEVISCIAALIFVRLYLTSLSKQIHEGKYLNCPAVCFWIFSIFCLAPIAFLGHDYSSAFIIPLAAHWFQYLAINFILVKRKYSDNVSQLKNLPAINPMLLFGVTCGFVCFTVLGFTVLSTVLTPKLLLSNILGGVVVAFGLTHYLLDAFLWRFRDPFLRESVLPFLKKQESSIVAV